MDIALVGPLVIKWMVLVWVTIYMLLDLGSNIRGLGSAIGKN